MLNPQSKSKCEPLDQSVVENRVVGPQDNDQLKEPLGKEIASMVVNYLASGWNIILTVLVIELVYYLR